MNILHIEEWLDKYIPDKITICLQPISTENIKEKN